MRIVVSTIILVTCFMIISNRVHGEKLAADKTSSLPSEQVLYILDFLQQVKEHHDAYKAAADGQLSAKLKSEESQLLLSPYLFANLQTTTDDKPGTLYTYNSVKTTNYQAGVNKQTSFGLNSKFYYNILGQHYDGLVIGPNKSNYNLIQASPVIELNFSLWRNWLGKETQKQLEMIDSGNSQNDHMQKFMMRSILVQSAIAYWNLALMRDTVRVARDSVLRNEKLLGWHQKRSADGLGEKTDVLQAEAALQVSKINLKNAQDNEIIAARAFNIARGKESPSVSESLMPLTSEFIHKLTPPERKSMREDVKASQAQMEQTKAAAEVNKQKYTPSFDLFASLALNNQNPLDTSNAYKDSFKAKNPTTVIGLRINVPLDQGTLHDVNLGLERDKASAEETYHHKILEEEDTWKGLNEKFHQALDRYHLYSELEKKQKEKFENEQDRRGVGRTTTQQVLLFENDYEVAQLSKIQSLYDFFTVYAQMKLFEEVQDESR